MDFAGESQFSVHIAPQLALGQHFSGTVQQHIARAGIEAEGLALSTCRQEGHVADAADVLDGAGKGTVRTGVGFMDHMLTLFARHGRMDLRVKADGDNYVDDHHTVEDTGIGIPDADMPYIFDRFYRVDKMRSRAVGGTGLGLSIVKDTVEYRGGSITVDGRGDNGGTVFTVRLPRTAEGVEQ